MFEKENNRDWVVAEGLSEGGARDLSEAQRQANLVAAVRNT